MRTQREPNQVTMDIRHIYRALALYRHINYLRPNALHVTSNFHGELASLNTHALLLQSNNLIAKLRD
jgi:hypothetical protein